MMVAITVPRLKHESLLFLFLFQLQLHHTNPNAVKNNMLLSKSRNAVEAIRYVATAAAAATLGRGAAAAVPTAISWRVCL